MLYSKSSLGIAAVALLIAILVVPVFAQNQSPATPQQRPRTSRGASDSMLRSSGSRTEDSSSQGAGSALDSRSRLSQDNASTPPQPRAETPPAASPAQSGADPDAGKASAGPPISPAAVRAAVGSPASRAGDGAAARMTRGAPGSVSIMGSGAYEPVLQRTLEYGDVPDEGESITTEGPMPLGEFLQLINMATNWNILVTQDAIGRMLQFWLNDKKPSEALEILKFHDIYYEWNSKTSFLYVMTKDEWLKKTYGDTKPHEFTVQHADIAYIESILSSLLSGAGRLISDQRTGHIYVWDTQDNLEQMVKTVEQLDVPLQKTEFTVAHADLGDIEGVLNSLLSPNGSLLSDPRTAQIFVWDSPTILEQMRLAVSRLDVPVESRQFEIAHVGAEDITDALEVLLSERGMIQVDPRFNAIVVTDLPGRLDRIESTLKVLDRELETRTWVVKYADIDFIAEQIQTQIPDEMGQIIVNEAVHQITVTGLPGRLDKVDELIQTWDIKRRQVLIEAYIAEVDSEVERQFNVNWSYFGGSGDVPIALHSGSGFKEIATASGAGESMSVGQLPYSVPLYGALELDAAGNIVRPILENISGKPMIGGFGGNNLSVTLNYLDSKNKATILSSPRVVVQDGEEATFENATRVPYISSSSGYPSARSTTDTGTTTNPYYGYGYYGNTSRVEFIDVGTILSVLPRVSEDLNILLDISAEDSTYKDKEIKAQDQTSTVPEKTVRHAQTQLRVHSGDTVVLGGLRRNRAAHAMTKTPLLGDIPLFGRLFRNPTRSSRHNTLLIFITTTIVDEFTHPEVGMLAEAVDGLAEATRHNDKSLFGRMHAKLPEGMQEAFPGGRKEIGLSIGQTGTIYSAGKRVSLEELSRTFHEQKHPGRVLVVIRKHPRAPQEVIMDVTEAAMEAELRVEFDDRVPPVVTHVDDTGKKTDPLDLVTRPEPLPDSQESEAVAAP